MRDRPSEAASRPAASGARSRRAVSAPRTMVGEAQQRLGREAELLDHHVEGAALAAVAPEHALDVERRGAEALGDRQRPPAARRTGTRPPGSTKRRISQGQAMRSILGRARVTQTVRPCASRGGSFAAGHQRQAGLRPGLEAALEAVGRHAGVAEPGGDALAELQALLADDDRRTAPANSRAHSGARLEGRRTEPGISRGSAAKSSSVRTSMSAGHFGVPIEAGELLDGDGVDRRHVRPPCEDQDAMLRHVASWGDRDPHGDTTGPGPASCQVKTRARGPS